MDVGYLRLGQSLSTLSGGEAQRLKLASELTRTGNVYVMDEPTTGLHPADIDRLLTIVDRLIAGGNTVVVIEHNLDVIAAADWIVDLGPEGGKGRRRHCRRGHARDYRRSPRDQPYRPLSEGTPDRTSRSNHRHPLGVVVHPDAWRRRPSFGVPVRRPITPSSD